MKIFERSKTKFEKWDYNLTAEKSFNGANEIENGRLKLDIDLDNDKTRNSTITLEFSLEDLKHLSKKYFDWIHDNHQKVQLKNERLSEALKWHKKEWKKLRKSLKNLKPENQSDLIVINRIDLSSDLMSEGLYNIKIPDTNYYLFDALNPQNKFESNIAFSIVKNIFSYFGIELLAQILNEVSSFTFCIQEEGIVCEDYIWHSPKNFEKEILRLVSDNKGIQNILGDFKINEEVDLPKLLRKITYFCYEQRFTL